MDEEIQLITDGDGLAVIGPSTLVERFLAAAGLLSLSRDIGLQQLGPLLRVGAGVAQAGSEIAANSGRWLKLTKESAQRVKEFGLMESKRPGVSHVMVGQPGSTKIKSWLQAETGLGSFSTNPTLLAGAAAIMSQLAIQHEMSEIKSYLSTISAKLDDVIRAQKDAELAKIIGAGLDIESALTVLERVGRVDDDTWTTVQGRTHTITDAFGWALLRLDTLAEKIESATKIGDVAEMVTETKPEIQELLTVAARCFELQDALDVLRLERVLKSAPSELDDHRLAIKDNREKGRRLFSQKINQLIARMEVAADMVNSHVLLHLPTHRAVVGSINQVRVAVDDFHGPLGIESRRHSLETTRWWDAAKDPMQLKNAATEAGRKTAKGAARLAVMGALVYVSMAVRTDSAAGEGCEAE